MLCNLCVFFVHPFLCGLATEVRCTMLVQARASLQDWGQHQNPWAKKHPKKTVQGNPFWRGRLGRKNERAFAWTIASNTVPTHTWGSDDLLPCVANHKNAMAALWISSWLVVFACDHVAAHWSLKIEARHKRALTPIIVGGFSNAMRRDLGINGWQISRKIQKKSNNRNAFWMCDFRAFRCSSPIHASRPRRLHPPSTTFSSWSDTGPMARTPRLPRIFAVFDDDAFESGIATKTLETVRLIGPMFPLKSPPRAARIYPVEGPPSIECIGDFAISCPFFVGDARCGGCTPCSARAHATQERTPMLQV